MKSDGQPLGPIARAAERRRSAKPRLAATLALTLSMLIGGMIVLAAFTTVPQITRAPGSIIPKGNYTQVETMEGGIVAAVHVVEGDEATAGTPLVRLHNPNLQREHQTLTEQFRALEQRLANAEATLRFVSGTVPMAASTVATLFEEGLITAAATLDVFIERQRIRDLTISQHRATIAILTDAATIAKDRVARQVDQLAQVRSLYLLGTISQRDVTAEEEQLDALRAGAIDAEVALAQAKSNLALAEADHRDALLALREEMQKQIAEITPLHAELQAALNSVAERRKGLDVIAPVSGIVQSVAFPNPGEVIDPGETLFELLPTDQSLVVEAKVPGSDIGHVSVQAPVSVSIDSYDVRRFGRVAGTITSFSPVPIVDGRTGETSFRASILLDSNRVGSGAYERYLQAGMTVTVEVATNEQTLLEYFLKPVVYTLRTAFSER